MGSILLSVFSEILFGIFFKFIPIINYGFNFFLEEISLNALKITFIYFLILQYIFYSQKNKKNFKIFLLELLLLSGIGNVIAVVINNFLLIPFINSFGYHNTSIVVPINLSNLIIYNAINIIIVTISFNSMVIFTLDFNKNETLSSNLSAVNPVLIAVIGLFTGLIVEPLNSLFTSILSGFIYILVPLIFAIILITIKKNSFLISNLMYYSIIFTFIFMGQITFILFFYPNDFSQSSILMIITAIIFNNSFDLTVNFFAFYFLIKFIILNTPFELLNEQSTHPKVNFTLPNIFKKRKASEYSTFNIEPSLEKIESILKENNEN